MLASRKELSVKHIRDTGARGDTSRTSPHTRTHVFARTHAHTNKFSLSRARARSPSRNNAPDTVPKLTQTHAHAHSAHTPSRRCATSELLTEHSWLYGNAYAQCDSAHTTLRVATAIAINAQIFCFWSSLFLVIISIISECYEQLQFVSFLVGH